jgi:hypothetical protein
MPLASIAGALRERQDRTVSAERLRLHARRRVQAAEIRARAVPGERLRFKPPAGIDNSCSSMTPRISSTSLSARRVPGTHESMLSTGESTVSNGSVASGFVPVVVLVLAAGVDRLERPDACRGAGPQQRLELSAAHGRERHRLVKGDVLAQPLPRDLLEVKRRRRATAEREAVTRGRPVDLQLALTPTVSVCETHQTPA